MFAGLGEVAVPVLNHAGTLERVLTLITVESAVSTHKEDPLNVALWGAQELSAMLGFRGAVYRGQDG